jgi:hypothetical protein
MLAGEGAGNTGSSPQAGQQREVAPLDSSYQLEVAGCYMLRDEAGECKEQGREVSLEE